MKEENDKYKSDIVKLQNDYNDLKTRIYIYIIFI